MRFAVIFGVLLLLGCANPKQEAHDVAQKFATAMSTNDRVQAEAQLTKVARQRGMVALVLKDSPKENAPSSVGEAVVEGENARVPISSESKEQATLLLRKEDKEWRVWGMEVLPKDAPLGGMTLNFEKPEESFKDFGRSMGEALGGMMKGFADGLKQGLGSSESASTSR